MQSTKLLRVAMLYGNVFLMISPISEEEKIAVSPEISAMFKAGMHIGYAKTRRHPKMRPFIYGTKNNVEVFDLQKVLPKFEEAKNVMRTLAMERKTILFVATKASAKDCIRKMAMELGMPYVVERWLGGTLTNFKIILERVQYWQDLERQQAEGEFKKYTKHEALKLSQQIEKFRYMFGGLETMSRLPHAMVVIDIKEEELAVREAEKKGIPILALSNSDTDPTHIAHVIPANDNAKSSIEFVCEALKKAYQDGLTKQIPLPEVVPAPISAEKNGGKDVKPKIDTAA